MLASCVINPESLLIRILWCCIAPIWKGLLPHFGLSRPCVIKKLNIITICEDKLLEAEYYEYNLCEKKI